MIDTACEHRRADRCTISAALYEHHAPCTDQACTVCQQQSTPRGLNAVTVSLAISGAVHAQDRAAADQLIAAHRHLLTRDPRSPDAEAQRAKLLQEIKTGDGPGSQLHRLLGTLGIHPGTNCACLSLAKRMNDLGVPGCREHRQEIVDNIRTRQDQYGWATRFKAAAAAVMTGVAWRLNPLDPIGSLVDEAIRRAADTRGRVSPRRASGLGETGPREETGPGEETGPRTKLILSTDLPPGDILTLTAAVESLHATYPGEYLTDVRTSHAAIWQNNPHITRITNDDPEARLLAMHYNKGPVSINRCNEVLCPFLGAYTDDLAQQIGRPLRLTTNRPHVYLTGPERAAVPTFNRGATPGADACHDRPIWLICAGIKRDWTTKQWPVEYYQQVVDATGDLVHWVQIGLKHHDHPELRNVTSLLDTGPPMRELIVLAWHAAGGLGPVTFLQHVMAAHDKPYICLVGGREPPAWVQYQRQHTLHTVGQLDCCATKACWKMRVFPLNDNATVGKGERKKKIDDSLCAHPRTDFSRPVPECMARIQPEEVIALLRRIAGGTVRV